VKNKEVEWKSTKLDICVNYEFNLFIRNRYVFFYAYASKYRKIINYAAKFTLPNNICIVYLYGELKAETIHNYISKIDGHICVVVVPISDSDTATIKEHQTLLLKLKSRGLLTDGKPNEAWQQSYESFKKAYSTNIDEWEQTAYFKEYEMIKAYEQAIIKRVKQAQYDKAVIYNNFLPEKKSECCLKTHSEDLIYIAQCLYPFGVESDTADENTVKVIGLKKHLKGLIDGKENTLGIKLNSEYGQLTFDVTVGASEIVSVIQSKVDNALKERGYIEINEVLFLLKQSPYGAYDCNWYGYIIASALLKYCCKPYKVSQLYLSTYNNCDALEWLKSPYGILHIENEKQKELLKMIRYIFNTEREANGIYPAISEACHKLSETTSTPLSCIDDRYRQMLCEHPENWCRWSTTDKYYDWLKSDVEKHKCEVWSADKTVNLQLIEKYGQHKVELFRKYYYIRGGAASWLHNGEDFYERVEKYMAKDVCRECGRPLICEEFKSKDFVIDNEDGELLRFTLKDIIGFNKKMLGRYQEEYYCIPCLCEVLDMSVQEIYDKIHFFKESGCQLF